MKIIYGIFFLASSINAWHISDREIKQIGQMIWTNECKNNIENLIFWNANEEFPSLGIGHFIWHTKPGASIFTQQFPDMITYLKKHHIKVPFWVGMKYAPWHDRNAFMADKDSKRMKELQTLLLQTIDLQAEFIVHRFQTISVPAMMQLANAQEQQKIKKQLQRLFATPGGAAAVIDYVNCKGDGTNPQERYNNHGWGLLQVLLAMKETHFAVQDFVASAQEILKARVTNAPQERNEQRFLSGWNNRIKSYLSIK